MTIHRSTDPVLFSSLHARCFDTVWTAQAFAGLLSSDAVHGFVALGDDGDACGFIVLRHAADEAEILTIGVVASHRRRGIAGTLLGHAVHNAAEAGIASLFLEVSQANAAAQAFYEAHGFSQAGIRRAYYRNRDGSRSDALIMKTVIPGAHS